MTCRRATTTLSAPASVKPSALRDDKQDPNLRWRIATRIRSMPPGLAATIRSEEHRFTRLGDRKTNGDARLRARFAYLLITTTVALDIPLDANPPSCVSRCAASSQVNFVTEPTPFS